MPSWRLHAAVSRLKGKGEKTGPDEVYEELGLGHGERMAFQNEGKTG